MKNSAALRLKRINLKYILFVLLFFLALFAVLGLKLGFIHLDFAAITDILLVKTGLKSSLELDENIIDIVWILRMPRILLAACVGMGLTLSGIIMQAVVKNPLADPYILGVSSGASLGATCAIFGGLGAYLGSQSIGICAFTGAFTVSVLVIAISGRSKNKSSSNLLLSGMAVSAICASLSSLIAFLGRDKEGMEAITYWLMGNVANAKIGNVIILMILFLIIFAYFLTQTRILNLMLVGYESAVTMGVDLEKYIKKYLILNGLLVGFIVFNSGTIGFVGLLIPHAVRLFFGANHRKLLPVAVVFGGLAAVVLDILSRTLIKGIDVPLGVIFAILGAPCFIYMMLKQNYRYGVK